MSDYVHPRKFFVPEVPPEYISDFDENSDTAEAALIRLLLHSDAATLPAPAVVVRGPGGTGKTTALRGVGNEPRIWSRFSDAVWFISLGKDADPSTLLEDLEAVVRGVVGLSEAEEIGRLCKGRNKGSAVAEAIQGLKDHAVLLLVDDVWADKHNHEVGYNTVFSLVQDCLRRVQRNAGRIRVVVSTRDRSVAELVPERCRVSAEPFKEVGSSARHLLCNYAEVSYQDVEIANSQAQESFVAILTRCGGLQLALAVAGRSVRELKESGAMRKDNVWTLYASELAQVEAFLKRTQPDHRGIYAMLQTSLEHLKACLDKDGVILPDELRILFSFLGVMKKQEAIPLTVLECIWGLSSDGTLRLCIALERMHLVSLTEEGGVRSVQVHDLILDFCDVLLNERRGRKSFAHRITAERLEKKLLGVGIPTDEWSGCAALWKLRDVTLDIAARDYCVGSIVRHMARAGGEYVLRLRYLLTDYRWIEARVALTRRGNDMGGVVKDVTTFITECGSQLDEEVKRGLELISDAARLAMPNVASNPRELAFQIEGRMNVHANQNLLVDRLLQSLDTYAERPWLKPGRGVLKAAGGAVVLSASLPKTLRCVAVLPSGEDVVVGGDEGYLAVFSIRYASVMYELHGHSGSVSCVAVCNASNRIFSGGWDRRIRAWKFGTEEQEGKTLLSHETEVRSLVLTADGSGVVFGDLHGFVLMCDSTSGQIRFRWHPHRDVVRSLAVRREDGLIISTSYDGTLTRWYPSSSHEIEGSTVVGGGRIYRVAFSGDGNRIVYATDEYVGILDAGNGKVLNRYNTDWSVYCAFFGSGDETIHFGGEDGRTAVLSPDGSIFGEVQAHSCFVQAAVQTQDRLLVSVSYDRTLSVQDLTRLESARATSRKERKDIRSLVVLPDRKRVLYSWLDGHGGLMLLNVSKLSPGIVLSEEELVNLSITIGSADARITAITTSRDGRWVAVGTTEGEVVVYDTSNWLSKYVSMRRLRGQVLTVAMSSNSNFLAAGSMGGEVSLFRLGDGSEVQLPSSRRVDGRISTVAFSEDSCLLLAIVNTMPKTIGVLRFWKHIDSEADIENVTLSLDRISQWRQAKYPVSVLATSSHITMRYLTGSEACVYDIKNNRFSMVASEDGEGDYEEFFEHFNQEDNCLEQEGALFMTPFGRAIRYSSTSNSEVLGTLETPLCSFRPEQWTFSKENSLFIGGGFRSRLVSACLVQEDGGHRQSEPKAPDPRLSHMDAARKVANSQVGQDQHQYTAFISHAGTDKQDFALPLYHRLMEMGIKTFVDKEELRPGDEGAQEMERAMQSADIGIFITSPEFVCREWTMRELSCFLNRRKDADLKGRKPPTVLPVFYRVDVHECRSDDLFNNAEFVQLAAKEGFFKPHRQIEMPVRKALECMKGLTAFTGIENERGVVNDIDCAEDRIENQMKRAQLIECVVDAVIEARERRLRLDEVDDVIEAGEQRPMLQEVGEQSRRRSRCVVA